MKMLSYIYTNTALSGKIQNIVKAYSFMYPATLYLRKLSVFISRGISGQIKIKIRAYLGSSQPLNILYREISFAGWILKAD